MISIETAEKALKTVYLDAVSEQLNKGISPFFSKIEQTEDDVSGAVIEKLIIPEYSGGVGSGSDTDMLPEPGAGRYVSIKAPLKNLYGSIEISDKALRASASNAGAFVNLLNAEMEGVLSASKYNLARMTVMGAGDGVVALVDGGSGDAAGKLKYTGTSYVLRDGMVLDVINGATGAVIPGFSNSRVIKIERATNTLWLDRSTAGGTVPTGSALAVHGSFGNEIIGLKGIAGKSATLYGLSRSEHPWLRPAEIEYTTPRSVKEFDISALQDCFDAVEIATGKTPNMILAGYEVRKRYVNQVKAMGMNIDYATLDGGHQAVTYCGVPFLADRFLEQNEMYVFNTDSFKLHRLCDWRWLEGDGGSVLKQKQGAPVYTATLVKYANLICDQPRSIAVIRNVKQ